MYFSKLTKKSKGTAEGIFTLMLLAVFVTELAVTGVLTALFARLGLFYASLLDAAVLVLLLSLPLWFFVVQPLARKSDAGIIRFSPRTLMLVVLTGVFMTQFLVMMALSLLLLPDVDSQITSLADACFTTIFSAPPLWWLTCSRHMRRKQAFEDDLLHAPLRLYALLLLLVFLSDLLMDIVGPRIFPHVSHTVSLVIAAFCSSLILAVPLWWFLVQPLIKSSRSQKMRANAIHTQAVEAFVTTDAKGMIESFNPAAEKIFGHDAGEIIGKPVTLLFNSDRQSPDNIFADESSSNHEEATVSFETSGRRRDGSIVTLDVSTSRMLLEGRQEYLMIIRDISERKLMENALLESATRFRQVFEQSEDAIVFFKSGSCSVLDANVTAQNLFGYSKAELQEAGLQLFIGPALLPSISNAISSISQDKGAFLDKIAGNRKDGREIVVSMRGKLMTLQGVSFTYCTFRDITERLNLEKEAREIQAKLIQTNKMTSLGLLVSGVAHEINNPNNFIMVNSQILERSWTDALKILREYYRDNGDFFIGGVPFSELDAHSRNLFEGIIDGARRIDGIVSNLKGFARKDRFIEDNAVNVNQVATAAVAILHYELNKFTENLHVELTEDLPCITGNSQQLSQIIINLLMNACQALPARQRGVWLTTAYDAAADQVTIAIKDEGHGISAERSALIMEPFFTTKLDSGGTGLGLSICQSIVKDQGWSMDFSSELGKGSTFTVRIPANH